MFAWLPVETLIRERQDEYYAALQRADSAGDSGVFVEFMLTAVHDALREINATAQVRCLLEALGEETLSASQI